MLHLSEPCVYVHCVGGCEFTAVTSSFKLCPDLPSLEWSAHIWSPYFIFTVIFAIATCCAFWLFDGQPHCFTVLPLSPSLFICLPLSRLFHIPPLLPLSFSPTLTHFTAHSAQAAAVNKRSCHRAFDEGIVLCVHSEPGTNYIWRTVWSLEAEMWWMFGSAELNQLTILNNWHAFQTTMI